MKRLMVILMVVFLLPSTALAVTNLTSTEIQPDIDRFKVTALKIKTIPALFIEIWVKFGYEYGGEFITVEPRMVKISNRDISYNGENVYRDDVNGMMLELPAAYQENPASKIVQEIDAGTFGGQAGLLLYLEAIIKTLFTL